MLQTEAPEDFVIATGESHSLQDFVSTAFGEVGLEWREHVQQDPALFRPLEISQSRGNAGKALKFLNWEATFKMQDVVREMLLHEQLG